MNANERRTALLFDGRAVDDPTLALIHAALVDGLAAGGWAVDQRRVDQRQRRVVNGAAVEEQGRAGLVRIHALSSGCACAVGRQLSPPARGSGGSFSSLAIVSSHHST